MIKVTLQVTIKDHIYETNKLNWRPNLIQNNTMKLSKTNNYKVVCVIHRKPETSLSVNLKGYLKKKQKTITSQTGAKHL